MASNPYDSRRLGLPANDINEAYITVNNHVTDMVGSINAVNTAVSGIPWDGASQQDMQTVWDGWVKAITNLLGTPDDPSTGSMSIVLNSLFQASGNYAAAEQQLEAAFNQMQSDIDTTSATPSGGPESVLVQFENNDFNAPSTFVEEIYSDDAGVSPFEGPTWTTSG
jgi:hypothetical protein